MKKVPLEAEKRTILGKKVSKLREKGLIPGHVFGKKIKTEHVSVKQTDFIKVLKEVGETGLVDLKISKLAADAVEEEKIKPVLIRQIQKDPVKGKMLNIDFYQVNLSEKTTVAVPVVLIGEEPEIVHTGEAVVIQPMMEVEVEALPTDLPEKIEVDITPLKAINDVILVSKLQIPESVKLLADPESVVVKLDTAVTEEMQELLEEQAAEAAAATEAAAEAQVVEGEKPAEGEVPEGEAVEGEEKPASPEEAKAEEKPQEEASKE